MNYLIISPARTGSTWLNLVLSKHLNLNNIGESLNKITPNFFMSKPANERHMKQFNTYQTNLPYDDSMKHLWNMNFRKLSKEEQMKELKRTPFVAKITAFDLYEEPIIDFKDIEPVKTIWMYRKNLVEHFLSFVAVHRTGVMNTDNRFMNYKRPNFRLDELVQGEMYHFLTHKKIWETVYKNYKFDYVISYEELFTMNELCGVPLKQYHDQFTVKLNQYSEEELNECQRLTELETNYEM